MTFEEDLTKRRIDVSAFAAGEPVRFAEWQQMYAQMHPNSFYVTVKMVLNDVRRRFWLAEAAKPLVPASETPAKPVRRASIPGTAKSADVTPPVVDMSAKTEPASSLPGKGQAVIRKPSPVNQELPVKPDYNAPTVGSEKPAGTPAPPRARPVIRKPAPTNSDLPPIENTPENPNAELLFHSNPDPEAEATAATPQLPRPRPVIKKPVALNTNEQPAILPVSEPAQTATVPVLLDINEVKPTRPRPVFKRPAAPANTTELTPGEPTLNASSLEMPVPQAEITNQEAENTTITNTELLAAKPPHPRPVIKKPNSKPIDLPEQPALPEKAESEAEAHAPEPTLLPEVPPKTSRPRPIFKRPAKPEGEL